MIENRTTPVVGEPAAQAETEAERSTRLARERDLLDEARADVRAGRIIADEQVEAWLDRLARGEPLFIPERPPASRRG